MNPKEKKISLSFRLAQLHLQKMEYQKYIQSRDDKLTLGDLMKDQLKKIQPVKKAKKKEDKDD